MDVGNGFYSLLNVVGSVAAHHLLVQEGIIRIHEYGPLYANLHDGSGVRIEMSRK